jgi:hypothetical protein
MTGNAKDRVGKALSGLSIAGLVLGGGVFLTGCGKGGTTPPKTDKKPDKTKSACSADKKKADEKTKGACPAGADKKKTDEKAKGACPAGADKKTDEKAKGACPAGADKKTN